MWAEATETFVTSCLKRGEPDSLCVQSALEANHTKRPPIKDNNSTAEAYYNDMRAGFMLLSIKPIQEVFYKYFGISARSFIGSGATVPWSHGSEYKNAQAREFLIPNYPETHKFVWTWRISPEQVAGRGRKVRDLIETVRPEESSNKEYDLANALPTLKKIMYDPLSQPPVIRFQQFSESKYKGTLGRPEAYRVFAVSLADVYEYQIEHAVRASGFLWDASNPTSSDTRLFVWIYIPYHNSEAVPAT
jgi:hypothetical protein